MQREIVVQDSGGVTITVKVVPNATRDQMAGVIGDRLKIRVSAIAESGKANVAVCMLLAHVLSVKKNTVSVTAGLSSPQKTIRVIDITKDMVMCKLGL